MTALGKQIKKRNIKQNVLAQKLGVTPASVCMQIQGGIRMAHTAEKYAAVLKCKPQKLMEF